LSATKEKSPEFNDFKGFVEAGVGEPLARRSQISNFELLKDFTNVLELLERINFVELVNSVPRSSTSGLASTLKIGN